MVGQGQTICSGLASFISCLVQLIVILCCDSIDSITITTRRSLRLINENFVIELFYLFATYASFQETNSKLKFSVSNWIEISPLLFLSYLQQ